MKPAAPQTGTIFINKNPDVYTRFISYVKKTRHLKERKTLGSYIRVHKLIYPLSKQNSAK